MHAPRNGRNPAWRGDVALAAQNYQNGLSARLALDRDAQPIAQRSRPRPPSGLKFAAASPTMPATTGKRGREEEPAVTPSVASPSFTHAPLSYFALEQLTPKGRRKNVDIGDPHDASRPLVKVGTASVGSWHCTEGGWDSAAPRPTTESFYVLTGEASVTDLDGTLHTFGPGDTVVLPKGWSGRWDVTKAIHKVWVVHDHEDVKGASVAASVTPPERFATAEMTQQARPPTGEALGGAHTVTHPQAAT